MILILAMVLLIGTCSGVTMSGSTTVLPLGVALSEAYTKDKVDVSGGGTGAGIQMAATGSTDIAMASRLITPDEKQEFSEGVVGTLIGYDGLCFIASNEVGVNKLTQEQVKGIYAGNITNWKQLGGIDHEIVPVGREDGSGTKDSFLKDIMGDPKAFTDGEMIRCGSSAEILLVVKQTPGAIGYVGFSFVKGVHVFMYENVTPSKETIQSQIYSLARPLYLYRVNTSTEDIEDFIKYASSPEGQQVALDTGFIPV